MRRHAFVIAILGLFILIILLNFLPPKPITSPAQLSSPNLQNNQKFIIQGNVIKESYSNNNKIIYLDSELKIQCPLPCPSYINKNITAIVYLEKYNNLNYLKALKIKVLTSFTVNKLFD